MVGSSTGKVMDQITEKVDSLSFDSPKHLSTFKFGLKKTTMGACETITSSDQQALAKLPDDASAAGDSDRFFPQRKSVSIPLQEQPHMSPSNLSWPSQTAPCSINPSRNPSRTPSQRAFLGSFPISNSLFPPTLHSSRRMNPKPMNSQSKDLVTLV